MKHKSKKQPASPFITTEELAHRWRTQPQAIRRWLKRGLLLSLKVPGRKYHLFKLSDVVAIEDAP